MVIRFYDFDFNLKHIEPKLVSSFWKIRYNGIGSFEAHFSNESEVLSLVSENRYLVAVQGDFAAIITGYEAREDLTVYGRTCNWILRKRLVLPFEKSDVLSGEAVCAIVSEAFSDVENFVVVNDGTDEEISFAKDSLSTVYDVVRDALSLTGKGHKVRFDTKNKNWVFEILSSEETGLLISESLKNAYETAVTTDILDLADCGYYKKRSESADSGDTEEYKFLSKDEKSGVYRWEAMLLGSDISEAKVSLNGKKEKTELVLNTHNILYGKDYLLGDIVRVQIVKGKLKKTAKRRIAGVDIRYSDCAKIEEAVFEEV